MAYLKFSIHTECANKCTTVWQSFHYHSICRDVFADPFKRCQVAVISVGNSAQAYISTGPTRRIYLRNPSAVTPLSARTFGTWTLLTAVVRIYAALNINDPSWYQVAFATFTVAWLHFMSEWWVFKSAGWGAGLAGPVFVSTGTMIWMWMSWNSYVG